METIFSHNIQTLEITASTAVTYNNNPGKT